LSGLTLTLGNPKAIVFFLALLPSIMDLGTLTLGAALMTAGLISIILPCVLMGYALSAHIARGFFRSPRALRNLNRTSAAAMAGAAAAIASR
jgi:threonine/homoserine/homoserine lactone efflux protein